MAGDNFGQSSVRAVAAKAIQAAGVPHCGREFRADLRARLLPDPIIDCPGAGKLAKDGEIVSADLVKGVVRNETTEVTLKARPIEPFLLTTLKASGIIPLVKKLGPEFGFKDL